MSQKRAGARGDGTDGDACVIGFSRSLGGGHRSARGGRAMARLWPVRGGPACVAVVTEISSGARFLWARRDFSKTGALPM